MDSEPRLVSRIKRKHVPRNSLRIELEKTQRSAEIGRQTGLFYVPRLLAHDEAEGTVDFEYLEGLRTVQEVAACGGATTLPLFRRIGEALAAVHAHLVLPPEMTKSLPDKWALSNQDDVFVHGDFTAQNVCFHDATHRIVILDWSTAPFVGEQSTFGSRYFDILWFVYFLFHHWPVRCIARWDAGRMADAFIEGYTGYGRRPLEWSAFRRFQEQMERYKRRKFWSGSRHYVWYRRPGYLGLWLWKSLRYRRYRPQPLLQQPVSQGGIR